jgi:hypothetical protein
LLATELRSWGWPVEVHRKWFKQTTADDEWIARVAEKHWKILTADKDLEFRYHDAIVAAQAAIFVVKELKPGEGYKKWVSMMDSCKRRIVHAALFAPCPFVARISRDGNVSRITHLMAHGRTKNISQSVAANFEMYLT